MQCLKAATYWEIGRRIVELEQGGKGRAKYGKELIKRLAFDFSQRFGRGFSVRSLYRMRTFYETYSHILTTVLAESEIGSGSGDQKLPAVLTEIQSYSQKDFTKISAIATVLPLPWAHYIRLMSLDDEKPRKFYEEEALRCGWSVRQLDPITCDYVL